MLGKYMWNGEDITLDIMVKIEHLVSIIAEYEGRAFDVVYTEFLNSNTYKILQRPDTLYWAESAEYLVAEYDREKQSKLATLTSRGDGKNTENEFVDA